MTPSELRPVTMISAFSILGASPHMLLKIGFDDFHCIIHRSTPLEVQSLLRQILAYTKMLACVDTSNFSEEECRSWHRSMLLSLVSYFWSFKSSALTNNFHQENLENARALVGGEGFCQLSHTIASFTKTIKQFERYLTLSEKLLHGPFYEPMIVDWVSYDNVGVHLRLHGTGMQAVVNLSESDIIGDLQTVRYINH